MFEDILANQAVLQKCKDQIEPSNLTRPKKVAQTNYFEVSEPSTVSDLIAKTRRS